MDSKCIEIIFYIGVIILAVIMFYFAMEKESIPLYIASIIIPFSLIAIGAYCSTIDDKKLYEECQILEQQISTQQEKVSNIELELVLNETKNSSIKDIYINEVKELNCCIKEYNKKAKEYNSKFRNELKIYEYKSQIYTKAVVE